MERLRNGNLPLVKPWFQLVFIIYVIALIVGVITGLLTGFMFVEGEANASFDTDMSVLSIFFHNLKINIFSIMGGLMFGLIPAIILIINGFMVGYVIVVVLVYYTSVPSLAVFYAVAPHAVPELFAFFFSCALGFRLFILFLDFKAIKFRRELVVLVLSVLVITISTYTAAYIEINVVGALLERTFPQLLQP